MTQLFFIVLAVLTMGCSDQSSEMKSSYAFFVVGHAYGNPITYGPGLHPPLLQNFSRITENARPDFGVLTGDVVAKNDRQSWERTLREIASFGVPVHIAPGNHDRGQVFNELFDSTSYSFVHHGDLFVILDTDNWIVTEEQIAMMQERFSQASEYNNVFVFSHELVWWAPDNRYGSIEINYRPHYPGSTNFYSDVRPILQQLPIDVYWFAGDVGSREDCTPLSISDEGNVTLIANGVGSNTKDNAILVYVNEEGSVTFDVVHLNGDDPNGMGDIEDYRF